MRKKSLVILLLIGGSITLLIDNMISKNETLINTFFLFNSRFDISAGSYLDLDRQSTISSSQSAAHLPSSLTPTTSTSSPSTTFHSPASLTPSIHTSTTPLMPPHSHNGSGFTTSIKSDFTPPAPPPPVVSSSNQDGGGYFGSHSNNNSSKNGVSLCDIKSMESTPPISAPYQPIAPPPMYQR